MRSFRRLGRWNTCSDVAGYYDDMFDGLQRIRWRSKKRKTQFVLWCYLISPNLGQAHTWQTDRVVPERKWSVFDAKGVILKLLGIRATDLLTWVVTGLKWGVLSAQIRKHGEICETQTCVRNVDGASAWGGERGECEPDWFRCRQTPFYPWLRFSVGLGFEQSSVQVSVFHSVFYSNKLFGL